MQKNQQSFLKGFRISFLFLMTASTIMLILQLMEVLYITAFSIENLTRALWIAAIPGWLYSGIFVSLVRFYRPGKDNSAIYHSLFYLTQSVLTIIIIAVSGWGYTTLSFLMLLIYTVLVFIFIYLFVKDTSDIRKGPDELSFKFIYASLLFLLISMLEPWLQVFPVAQALYASSWYTGELPVYFYFFYGGFLIFALIGLWVKQLQKNNIKPDKDKTNRAFWILLVSFVPAYMISLIGGGVSAPIYTIALLAAAGQLAGYYDLAAAYKGQSILKYIPGVNILAGIFFISLGLKFLLQLLSVLPWFTDVFFRSNDMMAAVMLLIVLGIGTSGLLYILNLQGFFDLTGKLSLWGLRLFLIGAGTTWAAMFANGARQWLSAPVIPYYNGFIIGGTSILFFGILLLMINTYKKH